MKYTCKITIDLPIEEVVDLWDNPNYFHEWQDGFKSIEHLSENPNTIGAKAKITFEGKRKIELIETIITSNLPHEKKALYEHIHMTNTQTTRFVSLGARKTEYISEVEYTEFNGLMIKIVAKIFPKQFRTQSQKWMDQFKVFAESERWRD